VSARRAVYSVGIVGAGRIGRVHALNAARLVPSLRVAAVADASGEATAALADALGCEAVAGWPELVARDDLDAVLVCSPPDTHADVVAAAAEAGKHVFCEKPLAPDLEGCDRAIAAAERAGVVLQVGFNRRFDRNFRVLREAVVAGRVGEPALLRITSRDPYEPPPTYGAEAGGSIFTDTTIHDLDLARYVVGAEIVEVSARAAALVTPEAHERGEADTAVTTLVFAGGALGAIDNCRLSAYGYDQRVELHGSAGMVQAGNEVEHTAVVADAEGFHASVLPHFFLERYAGAYVRELEAFAAALDGGPVEVDGADGRAAVVAALAAKRSADEGRRVRLDEVVP
jgi:myo-inositol 2-dehydrogenase / D-chiro-inositol 1-dehydrogenase